MVFLVRRSKIPPLMKTPTADDLRRINLIDPEQWNKAKWRGVGYAYFGDMFPCLILACENRPAAEKLFENLIARVGREDTKGLLRIVFVEGDILGQEPGYTVSIGTDIDNMITDLRNKGEEFDSNIFGFLSRPLRCPTSARMAQFKENFAKHQKCVLSPGDMTGRDFEKFRIVVPNVVFRRANEISSQDPDYAALK